MLSVWNDRNELYSVCCPLILFLGKMGKKFEKLTKFCHKGGQFWLFDTFDFIIIWVANWAIDFVSYSKV